MSAMYRLKAYFGMVPADEMADYADEPVERYPVPRRGRDHSEDRWDDRFSYTDDPYADDDPPARPEPVRVERDRRPVRSVTPDRDPRAGVTGLGPGAVRGALAIDTDAVLREPVRLPVAPSPQVVPEQRDRAAASPTRITTLQPRSYKEARTIGEHYRDGQPVIMNLTELDAADAKRLVDFAAGLAFALRGSIDKVTNRVFLLTPADVEVSADDARKLAERGIFRQD
ncbi:cell division protein SepF [Pseudonocardia hydrocarbonoxydans]|uniref:Cell division protein SepF n=1 Tax=Pseudonocardia hydrocarbonoxydans TaxID=76726 RepID=A0A4Y3WKL5_9PSEU|nr:cell division protein SepF [Pseudonocardia hydrocarbonoxydans]GEC18560.1 cell division protein SepF [Pseudonocardia hydrocarbonoxydans]